MADERENNRRKKGVEKYVGEQIGKPGWFGQMLIKAEALWDLMRDEKTPWPAKAVVAAATIYVISPIDLIPDTIPVLGQLDDLAVIWGTKAVLDHFWGGMWEEKEKGVRERRRAGSKQSKDDRKKNEGQGTGEAGTIWKVKD